jgi:Na+/proline symporter
MTHPYLLAAVLAYFALVFWVAHRTGRNATNEGFFVGNRSSPWPVVAFGMIGTTLSGVTFVSVPGSVGREGFTYFQVVLGNFAGFLATAFVLLPLYYRERVTSIYHVLEIRLGAGAHRTGAAFFLLSRTLGATARLYLVVNVLQAMLLDSYGVPFAITSLAVVALIVAYTFEGGVKTIVWTDLLQTACMLAGVAIITASLLSRMGLDPASGFDAMRGRGLATILSTDFLRADFFVKQFIAGAFIALTMTGMDQELMQKNISVRTLAGSQKNMAVMSAILLVVVFAFLYLGGLLHLYAEAAGIPERGDRLFPAVVMGYFPSAVQLVFIIALVSALFPSADGALTALTSSFCVDILGLGERRKLDDAAASRLRKRVHLAFAAIFLALVLGFHALGSPSMISVILTIAAYTYGPLLGLFAFAMLTKRRPADRRVPLVAIAAPLACYAVDHYQRALFGDYEVGLEILVLNGALTFAGLWLISRRRS